MKVRMVFGDVAGQCPTRLAPSLDQLVFLEVTRGEVVVIGLQRALRRAGARLPSRIDPIGLQYAFQEGDVDPAGTTAEQEWIALGHVTSLVKVKSRCKPMSRWPRWIRSWRDSGRDRSRRSARAGASADSGSVDRNVHGCGPQN